MLEAVLDLFKDPFPFTEVEDNDYRSFKLTGMDFSVNGYEVKGIGRASVMNAKGMAGLMKMSTLIINPIDVDAPLLSIDIIKAMGNIILFAEMYDSCLSFSLDEEPFGKICEKYSYLSDNEMGQNWYDDIRYDVSVAKKVPSKHAEDIEALSEEYAKAYLQLLKGADPCDRDAKLVKARAYSHGLVEQGGAATDSFLKSWGKEKTQDFFDKVLFG